MDDEHIPIAPIEQDPTPGAIAPPAEGWGKTVHESRSHYFVNGRALCRLFYLEEGRELNDVPAGDTCGCCARTLADRPSAIRLLSSIPEPEAA